MTNFAPVAMPSWESCSIGFPWLSPAMMPATRVPCPWVSQWFGFDGSSDGSRKSTAITLRWFVSTTVPPATLVGGSPSVSSANWHASASMPVSSTAPI